VRRVARDTEILDDPEVDLVCIASYDNFHYAQTMRALEHGKHVFVEKPFVLQEDEARVVYEQLRRHPRLRLSSNLVLRASPRFVDLRRRIDAGELADCSVWRATTTTAGCTRSRMAGAGSWASTRRAWRRGAHRDC
jgi:predicted dehydrogenase